ncbi:glutamate mutase, partial [Micromonospora craterilacus]
PDVVLLVGGTDGGDADTLTHNATRLARARWRVPVVLAGNVDVRDDLHGLLAGAGVPVTVADNVLPRIGVLAPVSARAAIRQVFLRHVIGGKRLSRGGRFARLVRAATPDAVLTGVEALADVVGGDLAVVDVGGATTDVYSVLTPDERASGPGREVAGALWRARTVEGDLGMRWSAPGV